MKNLQIFIVLVLSCCNTMAIVKEFNTSGDAEIDKIRAEFSTEKTTEAKFRERQLMFNMWMGALQQQGAHPRLYFNLDRRYY